MFQVFTIVARNYLALALTLADSIKRFHDEATVTIVVTDGLDGISVDREGINLISAESIIIDEFSDFAFKYDVTEFATAIKPFVFQKLLSNSESNVILYLDPDMIVLDKLDPLLVSLKKKSVIITPHIIETQIIEDRVYPEYKHLWEGIFNLGFCGVTSSPVGILFVNWWAERLKNYCYADKFDGLHTDQKWIDYAPVLFGENLEICRHRGVNVAHWNLDERALTRNAAGEILAGRDRLLIFHFSGFDFKSGMLTRHVTPEQQKRYNSPLLRELTAAYRTTVLANGHQAYMQIRYGFGHFTDGVPITSFHRRLYRDITKGGRKIARPFDSSELLYIALKRRRLLSNSDSATGNYSGKTLADFDRATRLAQTLLSLLLRVFGANTYSYAVKFFARYARAEAHAFLLDDQIG